MIFSRRFTQQLLDLLQFLIILVAAIVILVPIYWIVSGAFKQQVDIFQLKLLFTPTLENFKIIFQDPYHLEEKLLNSTLIAFFTVIIAIPLATMAAYSFSRFRLKGERIMFVTILATQFVPAVVIVLPFFILFRDLGILDTRLALVLVNLSLIMPFAIWMIKGFMDSIPIETEEAAMVDGSSRIQVIINVVVPMALPGVITAAIFCFILAWNEFLFAVIITTKKSRYPAGWTVDVPCRGRCTLAFDFRRRHHDHDAHVCAGHADSKTFCPGHDDGSRSLKGLKRWHR